MMKMQLPIRVVMSLALIAFTTSIVIAEEAAEKAEEKIEPWEKSVAFGLNLTRGNSETLLLTLDAKAKYEEDKNILNLGLTGNKGETTDQDNDEKEKTQEDLRGEIRYKRLLTDRWFAGMGLVNEHDKIADIDYRIFIHPSIGYFLVKNDEMKLSLEGGPSYVFEKVGGIKDDYLSPRIADEFEWKISKTSKVFQKAEFLFDVDDTDNYLINAEAGVEAAISSNLALVLSVVDGYDNQPAAGKDKNDFAVVSALKVSL